MRDKFQLFHKSAQRPGSYQESGLYGSREAAAAATAMPDLQKWHPANDHLDRYIQTETDCWLISHERVADTDADRIELAIELALENGQYDGDHHKMWVIDQMLRVLAGERYEQLITDWSVGEYGPDTHRWDEGTAP